MTPRSALHRMRRVVPLLLALAVHGSVPARPDAPADLPALARPLQASFFGTHLHRLHADPDRLAQPTPWPQDAVGALRLWDSTTRWADLQPQRGRWNFERMDAYVAEATDRGVRVLYVLGSTPRWASSRPSEPCPYGLGCSAEPADEADWEAYVRAVARRYRGRIHDYEVWNEPYFSDLPADRQQPHAFFSGSAKSMVRLATIAHRVLREEDPAARLLSPGFVGGPERLDLYLAAGGGALMDGLAYHLYADDERQMLSLLRAVRETLTRHGLSRLPLLNTEIGFAAVDPGLRGGSEVSAASLARSMVVAAFAGVESFYLHAWDNHRTGMRTAAAGEGPNAQAWRQVRRWLLGARLDGCEDRGAAGMRCSARRDGQRLVILWQHHRTSRVVLKPGERVETLFVAPPQSAQPAEIDIGSVPMAFIEPTAPP